MKSGRENSSEARYMITREKRAQNLGRDGRTKLAQVNVGIELLVIMLHHHWVCGGWLKKVNLLK